MLRGCHSACALEERHVSGSRVQVGCFHMGNTKSAHALSVRVYLTLKAAKLLRGSRHRYQNSLPSPVSQMAFSPTKNLLAWTDITGELTRWRDCIPASAPDPVKTSVGTSFVTVPVKRKGTPTLFDDDMGVAPRTAKGKDKDAELDEDLGIDLENDDWILDDVGVMDDDDGEARRLKAEGGVREMGVYLYILCNPSCYLTRRTVSVTKAQPAFQPGSTPMDNKKRYLGWINCLLIYAPS